MYDRIPARREAAAMMAAIFRLYGISDNERCRFSFPYGSIDRAVSFSGIRRRDG
tara:strand:+ start:14257 stop:14418 length:162 start_codon:yes stop_codon:yes gene_type:complete